MDFKNIDKQFLDYETAMTRFFNDAEMYGEIIELFIKSNLLAKLEESYNNKDYEKIFQIAHELKGACGNLSLTALYNKSSELTETVRNGIQDMQAFEQAYVSCVEVYNKTLNLLKSQM